MSNLVKKWEKTGLLGHLKGRDAELLSNSLEVLAKKIRSSSDNKQHVGLFVIPTMVRVFTAIKNKEAAPLIADDLFQFLVDKEDYFEEYSHMDFVDLCDQISSEFIERMQE